MCRMLAHWGPPVRVDDLVVDPPHSLLVQVTAARQQTSGHENPDGWGVGWYEPGQTVPHRYRSAEPMPSDRSGLDELAGLTAGRFFAHVRHKSPGSPTEVAGNAPFVDGHRLFAHNGFVEGFRDGVREQLRARLSPERLADLRGDADSEVLFALILDRLDAGDDLAAALGHVITGAGIDGRGKFNVLLTDGDQLVASRWGNSLYVRRDRPAPGSIVIASEPYDDDPDWEPVPDHTVVVVDASRITMTPLGPTPVEALP